MYNMVNQRFRSTDSLGCIFMEKRGMVSELLYLYFFPSKHKIFYHLSSQDDKRLHHIPLVKAGYILSEKKKLQVTFLSLRCAMIDAWAVMG